MNIPSTILHLVTCFSIQSAPQHLAWVTASGLKTAPGTAIFCWTSYPLRVSVIHGDHVEGFWCAEDRIRCDSDRGEPSFDPTWHSSYTDSVKGCLVDTSIPMDFVATDGNGRAEVGEIKSNADFTMDGKIDSLDFFGYLDAFFAGDTNTDYNDDGSVDSTDLFAFVNCFMGFCQ